MQTLNTMIFCFSMTLSKALFLTKWVLRDKIPTRALLNNIRLLNLKTNMMICWTWWILRVTMVKTNLMTRVTWVILFTSTTLVNNSKSSKMKKEIQRKRKKASTSRIILSWEEFKSKEKTKIIWWTKRVISMTCKATSLEQQTPMTLKRSSKKKMVELWTVARNNSFYDYVWLYIIHLMHHHA